MPPFSPRNLFMVRMPNEARIFHPPLVILRILMMITLIVLGCIDFVYNQRYARINTGIASIQAEIVPGARFPRMPEDPQPNYCGSPEFSWDMRNVFIQAVMGRQCMHNYTCDTWFPDNVIFKATESEWELTTALAGYPIPSTMPPPQAFDMRQLMTTNFSTFNNSHQQQIINDTFRGLQAYDCTPGYFVERAEDASVLVMNSVQAGGSLGNVKYPQTTLYDTDGNIVEVFGKGVPPRFKISDIFKVSWDTVHLAVGSFNPAATGLPPHLQFSFPNMTTRSVGIKGELNFDYTNVYDQALHDEVRCVIRPSLEVAAAATLTSGFLPVEDHINKKINTEPFISRGLRVSITSSSSFGGPHFFDTVLYFVSFSVIFSGIMSISTTLVTILRSLGKVKPEEAPEFDDQYTEEERQLWDKEKNPVDLEEGGRDENGETKKQSKTNGNVLTGVTPVE